MCPHPPTDDYRILAKDSKVPPGLRKAGLTQIELQITLPAILLKEVTVEETKETTENNESSTSNANFTCTRFSLGNKDFKDNISGTITNPDAMTAFPGVRIWDTKNISAKDTAGKPIYDSKGFIFKDATGKSIDDQAVLRAEYGLRQAHTFLRDVFGRNSLDGQGMELRASIHCSRGYANAGYYPRLKSMVFGDSGRFDGRFWLLPTNGETEQYKKPREALPANATDEEKRVRQYLEDLDKERIMNLHPWLESYDLDTIGHELTHGVVANTAQLGWKQYGADDWLAYSEAGILDEHIADCFGVMLKQWAAGTPSNAASWDFNPGTWSQYAVKARG